MCSNVILQLTLCGDTNRREYPNTVAFKISHLDKTKQQFKHANWKSIIEKVFKSFITVYETIIKPAYTSQT